MDFYLRLAFTIMLEAVVDKKKAPAIRKALLKLFKLTIDNFGHDADFRDYMNKFMSEQGFLQ